MIKSTEKSIVVSVKPSVSIENVQAIERLYQSSFASYEYAQSYNPGTDKYFFSITEDGKLKHAFVFEIKGRAINACTGMCTIEDKYLELFCKTCFEKYKQVNRISFNSLYNQPHFDSYAYHFTSYSDDYIIDLPDTIEDYRSMMAKNLKRNLNSSINRVKRDYPDFDFAILEQESIPKELIIKASDFNKTRMKEKGRVPGLTKKVNERLFKLCQSYGFVSRISIDGEIAAVIINTIVGKHLYFHVISHDSKYNYYRLGQVCLYLTIEDFIERGGERFHLLWGEFSYKYKFGGKKAVLYSVEVLRYSYQKNMRVLITQIRSKINFLKSLTAKKVIRFLKKKITSSLTKIKSNDINKND